MIYDVIGKFEKAGLDFERVKKTAKYQKRELKVEAKYHLKFGDESFKEADYGLAFSEYLEAFKYTRAAIHKYASQNVGPRLESVLNSKLIASIHKLIEVSPVIWLNKTEDTKYVKELLTATVPLDQNLKAELLKLVPECKQRVSS